MTHASIETTLEPWASSLRDVKQRVRSLFTQERVATSATLFLDGLLGAEPRKTGWMRAEAAGDSGPWRQQAILGRCRWAADALRDLVRDYVLEHLADEEAVLLLDETGFLKQGRTACGVARQYAGSAGKITNCQIGVFAAYAPRHGQAFIDRVRDVMLEAVERRFGQTLPPGPIQWLSDNGSAYTAEQTRAFAREIGLLPLTTPVCSPQSNGMAESFVKTMKRDYIAHMPRPDRLTALRNLAIAFEHYNEEHPHSALNYRSPREFRRMTATST